MSSLAKSCSEKVTQKELAARREGIEKRRTEEGIGAEMEREEGDIITGTEVRTMRVIVRGEDAVVGRRIGKRGDIVLEVLIDAIREKELEAWM